MRARRPTSRPLLALTLFAAMPATHAADATGNYAIWGLGQTSCNQFVTAFEQSDVAGYKHFVAGYLSAINRVSTDLYRVTGDRTMSQNLAVLVEYCQQHRMDSFDQALQGLINLAAKEQADGTSAWGRVPPSK
jgi:hypothetical protein